MSLGPMDLLALFGHFLSLSLLAVGGAISTAPDMHRYMVDERHWLTDAQFASSIALAQAAPGPNVLFIAVLGFNVGSQAGGPWMGLLAASLAMAGTLLPSTTLTYFVARWAHQHRGWRSIRAFKAGMAPVVVALMLATGWLLGDAHGGWREDAGLWAVSAVCALLVWRTRWHLLWLLAGGALLGGLGWV